MTDDSKNTNVRMVHNQNLSPRRQRLVIAALGAITTVAAIFHLPYFRALGPLKNLAATLGLTPFFAFAAYEGDRIKNTSRRDLTGLALTAFALRIAIPRALVSGSADVYRYLWDGRIQAHGINPYLYPPNAIVLRQLREPHIYPRIFRPDLRTVYPPLAEVWFLIAALVGETTVFGLKGIYLLHDCASAYLLIQLCRRARVPTIRAMIYLCSPLVVIQTYSAVHLDTLLIPWLLLALLYANRRPFIAGLALGAATMVRPLTALAGPALALRRPVSEIFFFGLGFVTIVAVLTVPYRHAGGAMVETLKIYAEHWRFNASLYPFLESFFGKDSQLRPAIYLVTVLVALGLGLWPSRTPDTTRQRATRAALAFAGYLFIAPTVYPWYALGALAVSVLHGFRPIFILTPLALTLSDLVWVDGRVGGDWTVPQSALALEYAILIGLIGFEAIRRLRIFRTTHHQGDPIETLQQ